MHLKRRLALVYAPIVVVILSLSSGRAEGGDTPAIISYGEGPLHTPTYTTWNGIDWADRVGTRSIGARVYWEVLRAHPSRAEAILGVLGRAACVTVQVWDGDSWEALLEVSSKTAPQNNWYRGFDIAYEQSSGDAIVVYSIGENDPEYRVWDGSSWSEPDTAHLLSDGIIRWVKLVPKPSSDTITLLALDDGEGVSAAIWDGSQFGDSICLETDATRSTTELMDGAWEGSSGNCLVVWGRMLSNSGYTYYNTWDGSQWGSSIQGPSLGSKCEPNWLRLAPKPASDTMLLAVGYDYLNSARLMVNLWDGSEWGSYMTVEPDKMEDRDRRCFDMVFESSGDQAVLGWSDQGFHTLDYRTWTSGTGWSDEMTGPDLGNDIKLVQLRADPYSDEMMLGTVTDDWHLQLTLWTGSSWGAVTLADSFSSRQKCESYMAALRAGAVTWSWVYPSSGSIGGIASSPTIRGGRVYVGSDDGNLYCLNASDGSLIWTYSTGDTIRSSPSAAYESGYWVIYFGSNDCYVYAVKDTGSSYEEKWTRNLGAGVNSSPALWDSLLYVGSNDDSIHCLRISDGGPKWATYLYDDISSSPAVFNDVVYIGSESDSLYALNQLDGTILRRYGACGDIVAPVFITWTTGQLIVGSCVSPTPGSDTIYIIDSNNFSTTWKFADSGNLARTSTSCFSLDDENVYFGNDNGNLYCIDLSGSTLVYKYDTRHPVHSSPLCWNGVVYFGSNNGAFYGLDDSSEKPRPTWPYITNDSVESSPAISLSENIVVVGARDGHVYAFELE